LISWCVSATAASVHRSKRPEGHMRQDPRPVVPKGFRDLAGAIPDCKKVMAKLAAGHRTGNDNGSEVP